MYVYWSRLRVCATYSYTRSCGAASDSRGKGGLGSAISEAVETEVDKQTCRRPRGHRKHVGVADGVGGAAKREIRVHPRARFSIVRPAGLRRKAGAGISRWKLICRDEKYRRRHPVSSWKYVALPGIRVADLYTRGDSRWCAHFDLYKSARSYKGSDFNRIAREYRAKTFGAKKKITVYTRELPLSRGS